MIKNTFWVLRLEPYEDRILLADADEDSSFVSSVEPAGLFRSQVTTSSIGNALKFYFFDERILAAAKLFYPNACFLQIEAAYKVVGQYTK